MEQGIREAAAAEPGTAAAAASGTPAIGGWGSSVSGEGGSWKSAAHYARADEVASDANPIDGTVYSAHMERHIRNF